MIDSTSEVVAITLGFALLVAVVYLVGLLIDWISGYDTTNFDEEDDHDDNHWTNGW